MDAVAEPTAERPANPSEDAAWVAYKAIEFVVSTLPEDGSAGYLAPWESAAHLSGLLRLGQLEAADLKQARADRRRLLVAWLDAHREWGE